MTAISEKNMSADLPHYSKLWASNKMSAFIPKYEKTAAQIFLFGVLALELQFLNGAVNFGNLVMCAASICAIICMLYGGRVERWNFPRFLAVDYVYFVYVAWCILSMAWSASPTNTAVQSVYLALLWVGCVYISRVPIDYIVRIVIWSAFVLALVSFAMIVVAPGLAFQPFSSTGFPELRGVFKHQLRLGAYMSVALVFMGIAFLNGNLREVVSKRNYVCVIVGLVLAACAAAALARSYSAYALLAAALGYFLSKRGALGWASVIALIILTVAIVWNSEALFQWFGDETGDPTLTGRTRIWEVTLQAYNEGSHLLGKGYGSFDLPAFDHMWNRYRPPHPHNSFINALFETGMIGAFLTSAFLLAQLLSGIRSGRLLGRNSYAVCLVLMSFLASLTGVNYAGKPVVLFALTMLIVRSEALTASKVASTLRRSRRSRPLPT
ncbi:O-antigen ligase family protein [Sphingobium aromaticiconvertens]|uniref:O-antigen ligase family protein n=1 Tax=Sphingobium aromaticiconvertens TaxID=365341 RepID=UPI003019286A